MNAWCSMLTLNKQIKQYTNITTLGSEIWKYMHRLCFKLRANSLWSSSDHCVGFGCHLWLRALLQLPLFYSFPGVLRTLWSHQSQAHLSIVKLVIIPSLKPFNNPMALKKNFMLCKIPHTLFSYIIHSLWPSASFVFPFLATVHCSLGARYSDNIREHLYNPSYVPDAPPSTLYMLTHLIVTAILRGTYSFVLNNCPFQNSC